MTAVDHMRRIFGYLWPRSLASQLIVLLLAAIFFAQALSIWIFHDERRIALVAAARDNLLARAVSIAELLEDTPLPLQSRILEASSSRFAVFWLGETPLARDPGQSRFEQRLQGILSKRLQHDQTVHVNIHADEKRGPKVRRTKDNDGDGSYSWRYVPKNERPPNLRKIMNKPEDLSLSIRMTDGRWLNVATSYRPAAGCLHSAARPTRAHRGPDRSYHRICRAKGHAPIKNPVCVRGEVRPRRRTGTAAIERTKGSSGADVFLQQHAGPPHPVREGIAHACSRRSATTCARRSRRSGSGRNSSTMKKIAKR